MNDHVHVRTLLALAASGDVSPEEMRLVQGHLARCEDCRRAGDDFALLAETLRAIPTPQPRPEILAQVRALMTSRPIPMSVRTGEAKLVAPLVAASWVVALMSWPVVKTLGEWLLDVWRLPAGGIGTALAIYSVLGFLLACASAVAVVRHARVPGRTQ